MAKDFILLVCFLWRNTYMQKKRSAVAEKLQTYRKSVSCTTLICPEGLNAAKSK